jgi:FdhE protein
MAIRRTDEEKVMRQGEVASQGKWVGTASGGVEAPQALVLPDPARRFADTARRLGVLATGHPMQEWLRFMMRLAQAQHVAATTLAPLAGLEQSRVEEAVETRTPPFAMDGYRREAAWREGLVRLLDSFDGHPIPALGRAVIARLRERDAHALEALADDFLQGDVEAADAGAVVYVAAALQVYFTHIIAGALVEGDRGRLWHGQGRDLR